VCVVFVRLPYLLPFPTRRSSDLEKEQITPLFTIPTLTPVEKADLPAIVDELRKTYQVTQKDTLGSWFFSFSGEEAADVFHVLYRSEGTRLNSSHVKFSYAVFCLK